MDSTTRTHNPPPAASRVESLIALAKKADAPPVLWYFSHLYGRSEIVRMTLHFAGIDFVFAGFSNSEWTAIKSSIQPDSHREPSWGLPMLQIDGSFLSQTKSIVRYVGQKGNLYPSNSMDIWRVESILEGADDLFAQFIKYHYNKYNTTAGVTSPFTPEDREKYGVVLRAAVQTTYRAFSKMLQGNAAGLYIVGGKLTIADILICQYRWLCAQPEFSSVCEGVFNTAADRDMILFEQYYANIGEKHFFKYFSSRYGSEDDVDSMAKNAAHAEGIQYPFVW